MSNSSKEDGKGNAPAIIAALLAGGAAGFGVATLTKKPVEAAAAGGPPIVIDDAVKAALAAILQQQLDTRDDLADIYDALINLGNTGNNINSVLLGISDALGAKPSVLPAQPNFILDPFQLDNKTLKSGTPFAIYEKASGQGSLIWAIVDVSNPNCKLSLRIDDLLWEFVYTTLNSQGVDRPLAPGVWLSKYDAANSHYVMIFSAGAVAGFAYKQRIQITVIYTGTTPATATLNQGRGVALLGV